MRQIPVFTRRYNGNEYEREGRNGRLYRGVLGWRWYPHLHGKPVGDPEGYKTKREAKAAAVAIEDLWRAWLREAAEQLRMLAGARDNLTDASED